MEREQKIEKLKVSVLMIAISLSITALICSAINVIQIYRSANDIIIQAAITELGPESRSDQAVGYSIDDIYDLDYYSPENPIPIDSNKELAHAKVDLNINIMVMAIVSSAAMLFCILRINKIKDNNKKISSRYQTLTDTMSIDEAANINNLINKKKIKRMINPWLWLCAPGLLCALAISLTAALINQYGMDITNTVCGVIEHYEVIHNPDVIHQLNDIEGLSTAVIVTPEDPSTTQIASMHADTAPDHIMVSDNKDSRNGFVYNYRELNGGLSISVQYDIKQYYWILGTYAVLFAIYAVAYIVIAYDNYLAVKDL